MSGGSGDGAPGERPDNWKSLGGAAAAGSEATSPPRDRRRRKKWLLLTPLGLIVLILLIIAEQALIRELDRRAIWQDEAFKAYLANPGPRNDEHLIAYECQYRPIGWIYRYRICITGGVGYQPDISKRPEPAYYLIVVGVKGYLSLLPEEGGDREITDRTLIWFLDNKLNLISDRRQKVEN